jgi:hypothetical protein
LPSAAYFPQKPLFNQVQQGPCREDAWEDPRRRHLGEHDKLGRINLGSFQSKPPGESPLRQLFDSLPECDFVELLDLGTLLVLLMACHASFAQLLECSDLCIRRNQGCAAEVDFAR